MDSCSLRMAASEAVEYPTAVMSIWTAVYRAAVRSSSNQSYSKKDENPGNSSCSEIHDEDRNKGLAELVRCLSSQITKWQEMRGS